MNIDRKMRRLEALYVDMQLIGVVRDVAEGERTVRRRGHILLESGDVVAKLHDHSGQRLVVGPEDLAAHGSGTGGEKRGWDEDRCDEQQREGNSFHGRFSCTRT